MITEPDITRLLRRWSQGDERAGEQALEALYRHLHQLAAGYLRQERVSHTLQPTALVHEVYLRTVGSSTEWQCREHFIALAANAMRRVLVDHARRRNRVKRGGGACRVPLLEAEPMRVPQDAEVEAVDEVLRDLERRDPQKARIVELRFFGGLSCDEVARLLGVSPSTVGREWRRAKAWLYVQLANDES